MIPLAYAAVLAEFVFGPLHHAVNRNSTPDAPVSGTAPRISRLGVAMSMMLFTMLTFFILLVSLSEIKQENEWETIVTEVKKAFGTHETASPHDDLIELEFIEPRK